MSFPAYEEYRDSGVEWLGEVPEHWGLRPLGSAFRERREKVNDTDFPPLSVTKNGIVPQLEHAAKTDDNDNRKCVLAGDFVINSRSDRKGSSGMATEDGSVSLINTVLRPNDGIVIRFVHHLFRSSNFQEEFYRFGKGIVADLWSTNYSAMKRICLAFPPTPEQKAIATFLDAETAKIDALVAEQRRLIELLQEKRQAVISRAVTKGLNPDAPMKPSGIEWLGDVPEHWKVARLSYFSSIENGSTPSRDNRDYWDHGTVPWISSGEVNQHRVQEPTALISEMALADCPVRLLPIGTVIVGMIGQGKTRGLAAILNIEATINQNLAALVPGVLLKSAYLHLIFQSVYVYLREFGRGGNQAALNCEILGAMKIPVPPIHEQIDISELVQKKLDDFDELMVEAERAIELLQERRTALISAVVTGKIDVREHAYQETA